MMGGSTANSLMPIGMIQPRERSEFAAELVQRERLVESCAEANHLIQSVTLRS
jgi:hypothetical protein